MAANGGPRIGRAWLAGLLTTAFMLVLADSSPKMLEVMRCEDVLHPAVWSVPFDELEAGSVEDWIRMKFPGADLVPNGPADFSWSADGKGFHSHFDPTYRYIEHYPTDDYPGDLQPHEQGPTVADVLRCFGSPDLYAVRDIPSEVWQVQFSMWYLNRGFVFGTAESKRLFVPNRFSLTSRLRDPVLIVPPGSAEQMEQSGWTTDPEIVMAVLADLKPWPDDFQAAE